MNSQIYSDAHGVVARAAENGGHVEILNERVGRTWKVTGIDWAEADTLLIRHDCFSSHPDDVDAGQLLECIESHPPRFVDLSVRADNGTLIYRNGLCGAFANEDGDAVLIVKS